MPTISADPGLAALGWDEGWASALAGASALALGGSPAQSQGGSPAQSQGGSPAQSEGGSPARSEGGSPGQAGAAALWPARVSRVDRGMCTVMTGTSELRVVTERSMSAAVGDWVALGPGPTVAERPQMVAVLPRRCVFRRANEAKGAAPQIVAANIDTVLICDALDGRLSLRHLERFLALAWQSGAAPVVLITKSDAAPPAVLAEAVEAVSAVSGDAPVVVVSAQGGDMKDLEPYLRPGQTVALLGLSGAGKSTLVNLLVGSQRLATGAVRGDGQGRHTTTHRELVLLPGGGLLIDTPGMRALSVVGASGGVEQAFADIEALAAECRHANCSHQGEEGCALAAAVLDGRLDGARLASWLRLRAEPRTLDRAAARGVVDERKRRKAAKTADRRAAKSSLRQPDLP